MRVDALEKRLQRQAENKGDGEQEKELQFYMG